MTPRLPLLLLASLGATLLGACGSSTHDRSEYDLDASTDIETDASTPLLPTPADAGPDTGEVDAGSDCTTTGLPSQPPQTCTIAGTYTLTRTPRCPNDCDLVPSSGAVTITEAAGKAVFDDGTTCTLVGCGCTTASGTTYVFMREQFLGASTAAGRLCTGAMLLRGELQ